MCYWKCDQYNTGSCKGWAITDKDIAFKTTGQHSHTPDPWDVQLKIQVSKMKSSAESLEPTDAIIINREVAQGVAKEHQSLLPRETSLKRTIQVSQSTIDKWDFIILSLPLSLSMPLIYQIINAEQTPLFLLNYMKMFISYLDFH